MNYTASERNLLKCALHSFAWKRTYIEINKLFIMFCFLIFFYHNFRWTKVLKLASKAELQNLDEDLESSQNKADLKRNSSFTSSTSTTNSIQSADWTNFRCWVLPVELLPIELLPVELLPVKPTSGVENSWTSGAETETAFRKKQNILFVVFFPPPGLFLFSISCYWITL